MRPRAVDLVLYIMSCFYPILIVGIGGCWSLPVPSSITLVWSLQDDGQNQSSFLCLVQGVYNVAGTVWFLTSNQSQSIILHSSRLNAATIWISSNRQYLLQYGVTRPYIPVVLNYSSSPFSENLETRSSSKSTTAIYWSSLPNTLLRSWEFSIPSSVDKVFIPSVDGHLSSLNLSPNFNETIKPLLLPSLHIQDLGGQISHIVTSETLHFLSSSPTDKSPDALTCFVAKTGHDDMLGNHEAISGGIDHQFCNKEKLSVELGHHMMQNVVLLLVMKIITFKLIIFDLLITGAAIVETCRRILHTSKCTEQRD